MLDLKNKKALNMLKSFKRTCHKQGNKDISTCHGFSVDRFETVTLIGHKSLLDISFSFPILIKY